MPSQPIRCPAVATFRNGAVVRFIVSTLCTAKCSEGICFAPVIIWKAMINKGGQKPGTQRGNCQRFPYEPRVVGDKKLLMPAELQAIHRYVVETPVLENVTEEIRAVAVWPKLKAKLPPKP